MRDILFKAKRTDNGEWVEGYYVKNEGTKTGFASVIFTDIDTMLPECFDFYEIDESTLCQYTGLTDKNGNKIWENDIFKHYNRTLQGDCESYVIGLVAWEESRCRFTNYDSIKNEHYFMNDSCVYETIGNTFDNPELLKGGE